VTQRMGGEIMSPAGGRAMLPFAAACSCMGTGGM